MTVSNVATSSPSSATTHTLAFPTSTTPGSTLIGCIRTGGTTTVTCQLVSGSALTARASSPVDNVGRDYYFTLENSPGGAQTMQFALSVGGAPRLAICEITDALSSSVDQSSSLTNLGSSGTAATTGATGTTAQAAEEAVAFLSFSTNQTFSQNGPWAILAVEPAAGSSRIALVHQTLSSTGTPNAAVDGNSSTTWIGQLVTFRTSAGGGGGAQDTPELYGRPSGIRGQNQMQQLLAS